MRRISRGEEATKVVAFLFLFSPFPPAGSEQSKKKWEIFRLSPPPSSVRTTPVSYFCLTGLEEEEEEEEEAG